VILRKFGGGGNWQKVQCRCTKVQGEGSADYGYTLLGAATRRTRQEVAAQPVHAVVNTLRSSDMIAAGAYVAGLKP
jgi:hypothetical protein